MRDLTERRMLIIVSHRLAVCKIVDKVMFISNGEIAGYDKHEALLKNNLSYAEMYNNQAKNYN